jgi:hypothetical protein
MKEDKNEYDMESGEMSSWKLRRRKVFIYSQKFWFDDGRRETGHSGSGIAILCDTLNRFSSSAVDEWTFKLEFWPPAYTMRFIGC